MPNALVKFPQVTSFAISPIATIKVVEWASWPRNLLKSNYYQPPPSFLLNTLIVMLPQANSTSPCHYLSPSPIKSKQILHYSFLKDFFPLLECLLTYSGHLIITGNFNLHINVTTDLSTIKFIDIITSLGLAQHVLGATRYAVHILDLIISHNDSTIIDNFHITDPLISDHSAIIFPLNLPKPPYHIQENQINK